MKVVSNTTPIIPLASIGQLKILKDLYDEILLPQAVYDEIKAKKAYGYNEVEAESIKVKQIKGQKVSRPFA
jgi:hypothetical protein